MDESGVRAFMADLMRTTDGPELFARRLWQRTGGNPMFLLETLRSLFDAGVLQADGDGWRTAIDDITVDYSELDVPPKVTAVIGRRLASLDGAAVRVLEALALAPVPLSATVLATITGLSVPATATALEAAEDAGFITDGSFRHDLLREATALRLSHNRKRVTHTLLAKAYAEESGESSDPGVLPELWRLAGATPDARRQGLRPAARVRPGGLHLAVLDWLAGAPARVPPGAALRALRVGLAEPTVAGGWLAQAGDMFDAATPEPHDAPELHAKHAVVRPAW